MKDNLSLSGSDQTEINKININPRDLPWSGCSKGTQLFEQATMFKRISPLLSPTGKEEHIPIEIVVCKKCGLVPAFIYKQIPDFPEELKSDCDK